MNEKQNFSKKSVYEVEEIQEIYQSENPPFKVIKIGSLYRIPKASFDHWLKDPS